MKSIIVPRKCQSHLYQSMVRSILDYTSTIWSPYTLKNIQILESVQKWSARFAFNDLMTTHLIIVYPTWLLILAGVLLLIGKMNID